MWHKVDLIMFLFSRVDVEEAPNQCQSFRGAELSQFHPLIQLQLFKSKKRLWNILGTPNKLRLLFITTIVQCTLLLCHIEQASWNDIRVQHQVPVTDHRDHVDTQTFILAGQSRGEKKWNVDLEGVTEQNHVSSALFNIIPNSLKKCPTYRRPCLLSLVL